MPDNQVNLTDPESPIISRGPGISTQGFNAQFAVDVENQIIVGSLVSSEATDRVLMVPVVQEIIDANDGKKPKEALLDSGYFSTAALADPILEGIDIYMPPERKPKKFQNPGPMAQRMREKIASEGGKARRKLRSTTVEPVFGQTKYGKGFQSFLTRGMTNVTTEWTLVGVAHNIQKILKRWK